MHDLEQNTKNGLLDIYRMCITRLKGFEIWPGYYKRRYDEFAKYYTIFPQKKFENTLEIGCGIGYQAAFLSSISTRVVASDVDFGNMKKHSLGLNITRRFITESGIQNIEIVNADAANLPFEDEQFDFIYSSYSFQDIKGKDKALSEIRRVLKKDGYFFCVLPTTFYLFKVTFNYYKAILKKLPVIIKSIFKKRPAVLIDNKNSGLTNRRHTKLLPMPDDADNNYFSELFLYSTTRWRHLFKKNSHRIIMKKYSNFRIGAKPGGFLRTLREKLVSGGIIFVTKK